MSLKPIPLRVDEQTHERWTAARRRLGFSSLHAFLVAAGDAVSVVRAGEDWVPGRLALRDGHLVAVDEDAPPPSWPVLLPRELWETLRPENVTLSP